MKSNYLLKIFIVLAVFTGGCGGKSSAASADTVVPIEQVCTLEKGRFVAIEGFIAPNTMVCEKALDKKTAGIIGCTVMVFSNPNKTGTSIPVYILVGKLMDDKNNRIENPAKYTGDLQFFDSRGNPIPKQGLRIYDDRGNLIPKDGKIRIYGKLPGSNKCELGTAEKIEIIEGEAKWRDTETTYPNFPKESF